MTINTVGDAFKAADKTPFKGHVDYVVELPKVYLLGLDNDPAIGIMVPAIDRSSGALVQYNILSDISSYQKGIKKHRGGR